MEFEWFRDPDGYRVLEATPDRPGEPFDHPVHGRVPATLLSGESGKPRRIVREGGDLQAYRPLEDRRLDKLYRAFAMCARTPEGLLEFINSYGPLTRSGLHQSQGDEVSLLIEHAESMYSWLISGHISLLDQPLQLSAPDFMVVRDPISRKPKLQICPKSMLDALWLQFSLDSEVKIKQCGFCGHPFDVGPGTGRRLDAIFCCNDHRTKFNSLKRSRPAPSAGGVQ